MPSPQFGPRVTTLNTASPNPETLWSHSLTAISRNRFGPEQARNGDFTITVLDWLSPGAKVIVTQMGTCSNPGSGKSPITEKVEIGVPGLSLLITVTV